MRLSTFGLAAVLLFSTAIFSTTILAQHSSGGGGGGSTGSSSSASSGGGGGGGGGGGFHGGSSGGSSSSSSSGGHSSGGSGSHSSGASGSSAHGSSGYSSTAHGSTWHSANSASSSLHANPGTRPTAQAPQKKSFFATLLHPFRKPQPTTKAVADLRGPICFKGPCAALCPKGRAVAGCGGSVVTNSFYRTCSAREIWSGGSCLQQTHFLDDCNGNRVLMEQQWQRLQAAEAARQGACSTGSAQECSDAAAESQTESNLYRQLHDRYLRCRLRRGFPFSSAFSFGGYSAGLSFDRLSLNGLQAEYR